MEASGWEKNGVDPDDEEAKQAFVEAYATQGIHIDKENVKLNPGLRYIAKLCLNRYVADWLIFKSGWEGA